MGYSAQTVIALAQTIQREAVALGFRIQESAANSRDFYDLLVTERGLRDVTRNLYLDGHYAQAVEEAYKYVNNVVKRLSGLSTDGADLMSRAFSINQPLLKLNHLRTESEQNQQKGYMQILAGCMTGIRNPRAHDHRYMDDQVVAIEMLGWANHLVRLINTAKRTRRKKAKGA